MDNTLYVIGCGAAGMTAAITAAKAGCKVVILEKNNSAGVKLSMTGNGKCNLTNDKLGSSDYNASARNRLDKWFLDVTNSDVKDFFYSLGLLLKSRDGYIYPSCEQASTVRNAFISELNALGVEIKYDQQLKEIEAFDNEKGVRIRTVSKGADNIYEGKGVIVATGGLAGPKSTLSSGDGYYILNKLGAEIIPQHPALVSFKIKKGDFISDIGVRAESEISFYKKEEGALEEGSTKAHGHSKSELKLLTSEFGEIQLTEASLSGIPSLQASSDVIGDFSDNIIAQIDFFHEYSVDDFEKLCLKRISWAKEKSKYLTFSQFLNGFCNEQICANVLRRFSYDAFDKIEREDDEELLKLLEYFRYFKLNIIGFEDYQKAQVTAGGVSLDSISDSFELINNKTQKKMGVYAIGELLDVNGRCGGYNLHFAFVSGIISGKAAAGLCRE